MTKLIALSLFVTALPFAVANADHPRHPHPPPQAAIDACAKSKAGDACSVTFHEHTLNGKCGNVPDVTPLVCKPDHPPPPPEALAACHDKAAGDACNFTIGDHAIAGTCKQHGDHPLACRPPHHDH
jgi:hypothetical protein